MESFCGVYLFSLRPVISWIKFCVLLAQGKVSFINYVWVLNRRELKNLYMTRLKPFLLNQENFWVTGTTKNVMNFCSSVWTSDPKFAMQESLVPLTHRRLLVQTSFRGAELCCIFRCSSCPKFLFLEIFLANRKYSIRLEACTERTCHSVIFTWKLPLRRVEWQVWQIGVLSTIDSDVFVGPTKRDFICYNEVCIGGKIFQSYR